MGRTLPQRVTTYNEFHGGVERYTYISWRAERAHLRRDAAGGEAAARRGSREGSYSSWCTFKQGGGGERESKFKVI